MVMMASVAVRATTRKSCASSRDGLRELPRFGALWILRFEFGIAVSPLAAGAGDSAPLWRGFQKGINHHTD